MTCQLSIVLCRVVVGLLLLRTCVGLGLANYEFSLRGQGGYLGLQGNRVKGASMASLSFFCRHLALTMYVRGLLRARKFKVQVSKVRVASQYVVIQR